jgi:hypothetical protein
MIIETCVAIAVRARGVWAWLIKREERFRDVETHREDRLRDVELEQARNTGTLSIIEKLALGGEVVEIDPNGRTREVRMPERPLPPTYRVVMERQEQRRHLGGPSNPGELTP